MPIHLHPRLAWQVIDGEGVMLDLDGQRAIGLNPTATFLLERLGKDDEDCLAEALTVHFEVEPDAARADVRSFLDDLRRRGFLAEGSD